MRFEQPKSDTHKTNLIGAGTEKRAYLLTDDARNVTLEFKYANYSNEQIKGLFYYQKLINALFPDHTITLHQTGNVANPDGTTTAYARTEFIHPTDDEIHQKLAQHYRIADGEPSRLSRSGDTLHEQALKRDELRSDVQTFIDEAITAGIWHTLDPWGPQDIIYGSDGSFKVVDTHVPWLEFSDEQSHKTTKKLLCYPDRIRSAINKLPPELQEQAHAYLNKILELFEAVPLIDTSKFDNPPMTSKELEQENW